MIRATLLVFFIRDLPWFKLALPKGWVKKMNRCNRAPNRLSFLYRFNIFKMKE